MGDILTRPDFIFLGGHKCGTTSLHYYLDQHPEIYMPSIKGQDFFSREGNVNKEGNFGQFATLEKYQEIYQGMTNEKVAGEVSSVYLYSEKACKNIKKYRPNAKLLVILRNPVDRAFASFSNRVILKKSELNEQINLREIFDKTEILDRGFYAEKLKLYYDNFDSKQIKILLFDWLIKDKERYFSNIFEFIGVNPDFMPDTSVILRKGGKIENKFINNILTKENFATSLIKSIIKPFTTPEQRLEIHRQLTTKFRKKTPLPKELRVELNSFYRQEILNLQDLINMDISDWLKPE